MEKETFFSDETINYRTPCDPVTGEKMHIKLRTGRYQTQSVLLCFLDGTQLPMSWEYEKNDFDFYGADITAGEEPAYYYFKITVGNDTVCYGKTGAAFDMDELVPFCIYPGFSTPEWSKGCLTYQIFADRFRNGDASNDICSGEYMYGDEPVIGSEWGKPVMNDTYRQFYGGDIQGIIEKIPYLKSLGIEALYLNPVFESPSSHKYDCADYGHIDTSLAVKNDPEASNEFMASFIDIAHKNGIRVILDGVFNHCSSSNAWFDADGVEKPDSFDSGAYSHPSSRFHDRFEFQNEECTEYEAWWDVETLPKLNYEKDASLTDDILGYAKKWISPPYNADGWRLDVAAELGHTEEYNHLFWKKFRKEVKNVSREVLITAEHYEDSSAWLKGDEWDSIMNYRAFMDPVTYFFTGLEKHGDAEDLSLKGNAEVFASTLTYHSALMPGSSLLSAMNQLDNHDHSRFLTRTNGITGRYRELGEKAAGEGIDKNVLRQAACFMYFWPGAPCLYYGDEAGVCGFTDPDNRRCYPWGNEDKELLDYFIKLGQLRERFCFVKQASCKIIYAEGGIIAFSRFTEDECLTAVFSMADEARKVSLPIWQSGYPGYKKKEDLKMIVENGPDGCDFSEKNVTAVYGILDIDIVPGGFKLFA